MKSLTGLILSVAVLIGLAAFSGCATHDGMALSRASPCPGGIWASARRGPTGRWEPGHWRCPR
jgi:hypothetical protein